MHIVLLASFGPSLLNFRGPLIRDMIARGYQVTVGAPNITGDVRQKIEELGAHVKETPLERNGTGIRSDILYLRELTRLLQELRPDLVLTYTIKPNIWGAFAASRAGATSIAMVTGLGYAFSGEAGTWKSRISRWLARRLYRAATERNRFIIFQNTDDRDDFISQGCLKDQDKVKIVNGSGVDLEHYELAPAIQTPVFLMISRLLISKGVREYFEAARIVKNRNPQAKFIFVGPHDNGPDAIERDQFRAWIDDRIVDWMGTVTDVRPILRDAAVYVLPSYREGTPRSVLEAMAMGRPIVTSDAPGCRETVVDGENGFLVPVRDVNALAEAMQHFIDDPSLVAIMGKKSHKIACEKYDVNKINADILEVLELA